MAQIIVNPARLRRTLAVFEAQAGEAALRCDVTPIKPALNFSFRFQAGYRVAVPAAQYLGKGHRWTVLTRLGVSAGVHKVEIHLGDNIVYREDTYVPLGEHRVVRVLSGLTRQ